MNGILTHAVTVRDLCVAVMFTALVTIIFTNVRRAKNNGEVMSEIVWAVGAMIATGLIVKFVLWSML